ncbi:23527_t:CDS:2, partial [Racocetra persica]
NISSPNANEIKIENKKLKDAIENEFSLLPGSNLDSNDKDMNDVIHQIQILKSKVLEYYVSINKHDKSIMNGEFIENKFSRPFFEWKNEEYSQEISKLLSGEEVILKTNITKSDSNKSAIKFDMIEIRFKTIDEAKQNEIDNELNRFRVIMVHLGNS